MSLPRLQQDYLVPEGFVLALETGDAILHFPAFSINRRLLLGQLVFVLLTQALHGLIHLALHLLLLVLIGKRTHCGLKFLQQVLIIILESFTLGLHVNNL
jgi:hypothetical protein